MIRKKTIILFSILAIATLVLAGTFSPPEIIAKAAPQQLVPGDGLLVGSGLTIGYPPNGFGYLAMNLVNYTFANSQPAANEFAIFQTHDPWAGTVVKDAIIGAGHTYSEFIPDQLAGFFFSTFRVVILNWDDTFISDFGTSYTSAIPALESYVSAGGVLWLQGSIQGSSGDNFAMPFGGQVNYDLSDTDWVLDPASPMVSGALNPLIGTSASHASFSGLPATAHIVATKTNAIGAPVLYEFSPATCGTPAQWIQVADFPSPLIRAAGIWYPPNGRFYSLGGRTSDAAGSDILNPYEYDPITDSWSVKTAAYNNNQVNNMAAGLLNVGGNWLVYTVGGSAAGATTATPEVRVYDPLADTITVITTDPWPAPANTLPGGSVVFDNKLYILGGFIINISMSDQIWVFDPNAANGTRWTLKAAILPIPLGYIPAAVIGSNIYTGGGSEWVGGTLQDSTASYRYDPVVDSITTITSIPRPTGETRALEVNGEMWVLGGGRTAPNPSNEVDIYNPNTDLWSTGLPFTTARRNFPADINPLSGEIYLVGGYAPSTAISNMLVYHPGVACNRNIYLPVICKPGP